MNHYLAIDYSGHVKDSAFVACLTFDNKRVSPLVSISLRDGKLSGNGEMVVNTFTVDELRQLMCVLQNINDLIFSGEHVGPR